MKVLKFEHRYTFLHDVMLLVAVLIFIYQQYFAFEFRRK